MSDEQDEITLSEANDLDEDLSALVDGEFSSERAAELSRLAERDPAVAARIEAFAELGSELSTWVAMPGAESGERLRAALAARLEQEEPSRSDLVADPDLASGLDLHPGSTAPLAAGSESARRRFRNPAPRRSTRSRWTAPSIAAGIGAAIAAGLALFFAVRPVAGPVSPPGDRVAVVFDGASSDELQMALELQVLEDLEVIEQLDVLERLSMLDDEAGRG